MNFADALPPAPPLAPTWPGRAEQADLRRALVALGSTSVRGVVIRATAPGMRPRELDRSARRDLAAALRRAELTLAGLDGFIPAEHITDPARADRAVHAMLAIIDLAADLADPGNRSARLVHTRLPEAAAADDPSAQALLDQAISAIAERAAHRAITIACPPSGSYQSPPFATAIHIDAPETVAAIPAAPHLVAARITPAVLDDPRLDRTALRIGLSLHDQIDWLTLDLRGDHDDLATITRATEQWPTTPE